MARRWNKRIARAGDETGLTIIEVLIAAVVLTMGAAATFGILGAATKNAQRAKATQVSLDLAQEELERLHGIPYANLAVNTMPTAAPRSSTRTRGSAAGASRSSATRRANSHRSWWTKTASTRNPTSTTAIRTAVGSKGRSIATSSGRTTRLVRNPSVPGNEDYKQVIVAVKPDRPVSQSGERGYVEVQSKVTDPESAESGGPEGEGDPKEEDPEDDVTAQQFYLTDTPCAATGTTTRVEPTADHLLHNTLGTCANGLKNGTKEVGAPDALLLSPPPDPAPEDDSLPVLHDYADDFYLEPTPDTDKGVQIRRDDTPGCHYKPTGATNPESQVHRWVSDKMTSTFEMEGRVTLEFYTRTLNDAIYKGALCVYLFDRSETGTPPVPNDEFFSEKGSGGTLYWLYVPEGNAYWPRNLWTRVRVTMEFDRAPHLLLKDHRLGVALSVDRGGTPADAIPIMYDHPNYPTRLEVDTSNPIEGG